MSRIYRLVIACLITPFAIANLGRADFVYSGMATGAVATVEVTFLVGSTGPLPSAGGVRTVNLPSSSVNSILSTGSLSGIAMGSAGLTTADITVNDLVLTFGGNTITAQMVGGHATADGRAGSQPTVNGFSELLGLTVNGQSIMVTGMPNQQIDLLNNERLVLNEQFPTMGDTFGSITLNALHLYGGPVVDFRIASAHAGITVNANIGPVPEPGALALLAVGLAGLLRLRSVKLAR